VVGRAQEPSRSIKLRSGFYILYWGVCGGCIPPGEREAESRRIGAGGRLSPTDYLFINDAILVKKNEKMKGAVYNLLKALKE
jgi:hypothetical protein